VGEMINHIKENPTQEPLEEVGPVREILLFASSVQKTWLLFSNCRMYCFLDDISRDAFEEKFSLSKDEIVVNGKILPDIEINVEYKEKTGLISFTRQRKFWLFSKTLFPTEFALKAKIENIIKEKMINSDLMAAA